MKRSRGRSRKSGNQLNRQMDSNGPDVKIRGTASHIFEKYQSLARDAGSAGDRIMAENYLQHAEHYYRVVRAANGAVAKDNLGREAENDRAAEEGAETDAVSADLDAQPNGAADAQADAGDKNNSDRNGGDKNGAQKAKTRKPVAKADEDGDANSGRRRGRRRSANGSAGHGSSGNGKGEAVDGLGNGGRGGDADGPVIGGDEPVASGPEKSEDGVVSPVASNDVAADKEAVA